jgi:hypothetical protein
MAVHVYNPSSGAWAKYQDHGSKPAWANSLRPYLEKPHQKKGLVEWLEV